MDDLRHKLGYAWVQERETIRARLATTGLSGIELAVATDREQMALHANDPSYRETSAQLVAKWAAQDKLALVGFTVDELRWLSDHFENANDPMAQAIGEKVGDALRRKGA